MRRIDFPNLIYQSVAELMADEKIQSNARLRVRIQFLRLLKSGQVTQLKQVALIVGITPKHASSLWKKYREKGIEQFLTLGYKAGSSRLSFEQQAKLLTKAESGFGSQREAIEYIKREFDRVYTQQGVSVLFARLKIKAKAARPMNVLADAGKQSEYKKTLPGG